MHISGKDAFCSSVAGYRRPSVPSWEQSVEAEARRPLGGDLSVLRDGTLEGERFEVGGMVPYFGSGEVSQAVVMVAAAEESASHYSPIAVYLRLNRLLPRRPTEARIRERLLTTSNGGYQR
jgi:hypothetical protein